MKLIEYVLEGYVPVQLDGSIHRPTLSNAYNHMFDKGNRSPTRKGVRKIYDTAKKAASYSPDKLSEPVYRKVKQPDYEIRKMDFVYRLFHKKLFQGDYDNYELAEEAMRQHKEATK